MYVVINGAGRVGSYLATLLHAAGHEVVVIEKQLEACKELAARLPILVMQGDGCDVNDQLEAGTPRADVFVSVTGDDDDNLVACQLAKVSYEISRTVARINNPENEPIFHALGIEGISSTTIIAQLVQEEATIGDILTLRTLRRGTVALVEIEVPAASTVVGQTVVEMGLPTNCVLVAVLRGDEVLLPRGDTAIEEGDRIVALTAVDQEPLLHDLFRARKRRR